MNSVHLETWNLSRPNNFGKAKGKGPAMTSLETQLSSANISKAQAVNAAYCHSTRVNAI